MINLEITKILLTKFKGHLYSMLTEKWEGQH